MNSRAPVALAIGVGYLLGRTHKMRWALLLGSAAATGRLNGLSTQVLERGTQALRSSPELTKIADSAGRLVDAGRAAAVSAMSSRVESLGSKLEDQAGRLGEQGTDVVTRGKRGAAGATRRGRAAEETDEDEPDADYNAEYDSQDENDSQDEYDSNDRYDADDEYDARDEDDYDEDEPDEDEPAASQETKRRSSGPVVRKTGR